MDTPSATPPSSSSGSNKKILIIILAVVLGLGLLSLVGSWVAAKAVGFGLKKALEAGTGITFDENDGVVSLNGRNGEQVRFTNEGFAFSDNQGNTTTVRAEEGKLPPDFTTEFPIHASMTAQGGSVTQAPKGSLHMGTWTSSASVETLTAWYQIELAARGWTIQQTAGGTADAGALMTFSRGRGKDEDGGQLNISTDDEGRVVVSLFLTIAN